MQGCIGLYNKFHLNNPLHHFFCVILLWKYLLLHVCMVDWIINGAYFDFRYNVVCLCHFASWLYYLCSGRFGIVINFYKSTGNFIRRRVQTRLVHFVVSFVRNWCAWRKISNTLQYNWIECPITAFILNSFYFNNWYCLS